MQSRGAELGGAPEDRSRGSGSGSASARSARRSTSSASAAPWSGSSAACASADSEARAARALVALGQRLRRDDRFERGFVARARCQELVAHGIGRAASSSAKPACSAYRGLPAQMRATMATRAAPDAATMVAALPPPGAGASEASAARYSSSVIRAVRSSGGLRGPCDEEADPRSSNYGAERSRLTPEPPHGGLC